jgi:hypothetical protein
MCVPALSPPTKEIALIAGWSQILFTVSADPWTLVVSYTAKIVANIHIDDSWRHACPFAELCDDHCSSWVPLGWLDHEGISCLLADPWIKRAAYR